MSDKVRIAKIAFKARQSLDRAVSKRKRWSPHLGGLCGLASVYLHDCLTNAGYKAKIIQAPGHYFIECEGWLVDITGTQFGQPKVIVRSFDKVQQQIREKTYAYFWWEFEKSYSSVEESGLRGYRDEIAKMIHE